MIMERTKLLTKINELIESYPVLDVGTRNGRTDYIDYIDPSELTSVVMRGTDKFKRPFIVIKVTGHSISGEDTRVYYETFFQRYSDDNSLWMGAYCGGPEFMDTTGGMKFEQFQLLIDLLEGKTINYNHYRNYEVVMNYSLAQS